jgi:hypothetical protein
MPDNSKAKATEEEVKAYLSTGGVKCVFKNCLSEDIDTDTFQSGCEGAEQAVTCPDCDGAWTDMLTLTQVNQS